MDFRDALDSRNLKLYLEEISRFPQLSEEDERRLGERARKGDEKALNDLIQSNLKFVVSYAKRYRGMGLGLADLINEGNLGLIEAAKRFDPGRGVRFISYAVWWIRQSLVHALSRSSHIYNIPQKLSDRISLMKRKAAALKAELGREPRRDEVAAAMKISEEELANLEMIEERNLSMSDKLHDDDTEVEERIGDETVPSVESQVIKASVQQKIREMIDELDEKEALVLKLRFGLEDDRPRTLQEIGDELGLTRERIRQIEQKAMRKLSLSRRMQQLRGYLN